MNRKELEQLWGETLRSPTSNREQFDRLVQGVLDVFASDDQHFKQHIKNRFHRVTARTGKHFDADHFDIAMGRAFVADEIGFASWDELIGSVEDSARDGLPILFRFAIAAMDMGNFTSLEKTVGGPDAFDNQMIDWYEKGYFAEHQETLAEIFAAACLLGHPKTAEYLLDKGVDPYSGMKTGLAGFHYAVSGGRLSVVKALIARRIPTDVENMYGGTVLGQALWSAINEHNENHAAIIEALVDAGAHVWPGTVEWWEKQEVPSVQTKQRVVEVLGRYDPQN